MANELLPEQGFDHSRVVIDWCMCLCFIHEGEQKRKMIIIASLNP